MRIVYLFFVLALLSNLAIAQPGFLPENLGNGVNTPYDEINPVVSPDGKILFFTRVNHPENTFGAYDSEDIWYAEQQPGGSWGAAQRIPNLNIGRYNAVLSVSEDGSTILLNGVFNKKGNIWKKRGLSVSTKMGSEWSVPERLRVKTLSRRNRGFKSSASMSTGGQFIIFSFSRTYNSERSNLFISERKEDGAYRRPRKLKNVNSGRSEDAPFLSSDGKTLYFASDRKQKNVFDIYTSTRQGESAREWSAPVAMSENVNSSEWDSYFKTDIKGVVAYFSSSRETQKGADLFKVKLIEDNPFVIVSGTVMNAETMELLKNKSFRILANGSPVDSITVNSDSATYRIKLPLHQQYILTASLPDFTAIPDTVDVRNNQEFLTLKNDLFAKPLPFVLVKGKLRDKTTNEILRAGSTPKVLINGAESDSVTINTEDGTYEVKLRRGASYQLQVSAENFDATPETLDLTGVHEYREMTLDLGAEQKKPEPVVVPVIVDQPAVVMRTAIVSGKIINQKTGEPVISNETLKVLVNGAATPDANIDAASGTYQMKLTQGKTYTINASAQNFYPVYEAVDLSNNKEDLRITRDLIIAPIEVGQSIRINNVFFETGKAILKKQSFPELERVVSFLQDNGDMKLEIAGHTDNVGAPAMNQSLSEARAKAVVNYIVSKGIPKGQLVAKGYGLTKPVAPNATKEGKAKNRRVEFTILTK